MPRCQQEKVKPMPKRKYFRHIYLDEWKEASEKLKAKYPSGALPDFRNVWVQVESIEDCRCTHTPNEHTLDNWPDKFNCLKCECQQYRKQEKILALVEFDQRTCINTLDADNPVAARDIINWADGYLGDYPQYEFQVPDTNTRMQKALLRHFGLEGEVEPPHRVYIIRRQ